MLGLGLELLGVAMLVPLAAQQAWVDPMYTARRQQRRRCREQEVCGLDRSLPPLLRYDMGGARR